MRMVLADDHDMFLDAFALAMSQRGHDVLAAVTEPDDVADAVRNLAPDICVVDLTYARIPRPELADVVHRIDPAVAVVVLSGAPDARVWAAYDAGRVRAVIGKGCDLDTLERALLAAARGERTVVGLSRPAPVQTRPAVVRMTDREREVMLLLLDGASTREMVRALGISANTVRTHVQHVLDKLGVHTRVQAAARAVQLDLVDCEPVGA